MPALLGDVSITFTIALPAELDVVSGVADGLVIEFGVRTDLEIDPSTRHQFTVEIP